ncbi:MAG TPA: hypothetical protein VFZ88_07935 [Sphingomicrobium sp.]|jgi:hypothetical protein
MLRFIFPIVTITAIMSIGACSSESDPVADGANDVAAIPAEANAPTADENSVTPTNELESGTAEPVNDRASTIPASLHGRWGLTPGDCTSTRGDAKGLLIVSAQSLKFYESLAKPAGPLKASPNSASGDFTFTGEGMTWKKFEALELQDNKLVRTESDPMASFTYARCAT